VKVLNKDIFTTIYCAVDFAAEVSHQAVFYNMGQCCTAGSRTFVQEDIYEEFTKRLVNRAKVRKVGDPYDPAMESGPQVKSLM